MAAFAQAVTALENLDPLICLSRSGFGCLTESKTDDPLVLLDGWLTDTLMRMPCRVRILAGAAIFWLLSAAASATDLPPVLVSKTAEADRTHTLVHEVIVDAPMADVWAAISTPEGWKTWAVPVAWAPAGQIDVLETSYDPAANPGDPGTIQQRFTARIPGRMLAFKTVKVPARFPHWESYRRVSSVFELEPLSASSTRVRLTGVGYPDTPAGKDLLAFFEKGNADSLNWLRLRFAEGPADWKKRLSGGDQR